MPVPASINDLSTVAGGNSPDGASESPKLGDDYLRALSSFLAQLRDQLNGTSNSGTIKNPVFSGTSTGTITIAGVTLPSPTISGTPVISSAAVTWSGNPTHSGNHTWSGTQTFNGPIAYATTPIGLAISAFKSSDTSRASTISLTNDPELQVSLGIGTWAIHVHVYYWATTNGAGGFASGLTFSGTRTNGTYWNEFGQGTGAAVLGIQAADLTIGVNNSSGIVIGTSSNGASTIRLTGNITVTAAGVLAFRWAQSFSNANAANVGIGSFISCTRMA
jgi:hypothetical protein